MKKSILMCALAFAVLSCEKKAAAPKEFKTAYIDIAKILQESTEAKDINAKFEAKAAVMQAKLKAEAAKFENEARDFEKNAQANGAAWAQQKGSELQQRKQQLQYAQQSIGQELQGKMGVEMDSLSTKMRKVFKKYGKEKGFDYIYGTGDAATILYAKDNYDITKELTKIINDGYTKPVSK
ncbi:MAG: OmpH family outer membrane protein [Flavobacterium sp.]|nr:OmpH family outer membrane protein [Flavobacterium sp.]